MNSLRRKFTLLYTITTGMILSLILGILFFWSISQKKQELVSNFTMQMDQAQAKFQSSKMFSSSDFLQLEYKNHIIFSFEENGSRLFYTGSYQPLTDREILIQEVIQRASEEKIDITICPMSPFYQKSSIYSMKGVGGERFYGQLVLLPMDGGWQSLVMVKEISKQQFNYSNRILFFLLIDVLGTLGVFFFSRMFVGKTLKPVEEAQRKQKEFIAAASHELRSPLAVIKTGVSAMLRSKDRQKEFAQDVNEEIERMTKLIDEMLLLASAQLPSWHLKQEMFALDNFIIDSYDKLLLLLSNKSITLQISLPDNMSGQVYGDRERLYQVLSILVDNAASYTDVNGKIDLVVSSQKHCYELDVIDYGKGISPEDQEHIFEQFYRCDKARNDKAHYGLGLSIAYEIIKCMNGSLKVKDTEGGGTTFVIELPIN